MHSSPHQRSWTRRTRRVAAAGLCAAGLVTAALPVFALPVPVRVERAEAPKPTLPTLRFLRENRDFLRRRVDALRVIPLQAPTPGTTVDPRYLLHGAVLDSALMDLDTLSTKAEERALLSSITELGHLETELDRLEALLVDQNTRLAGLEADFLQDQGTELVVVVRGVPAGGLPDSLRVVDGFGDVHPLPITPEVSEALRSGGIVEVTHLRAEPREQSWSVAALGATWSGETTAITFVPPRQRLTFLELDLTGLRPETGTTGVGVMAWVDEGSLSSSGSFGSR